ncbi:MAG: DUF2281 domain-containing protein, partial [Pseudomonadota bacterium]
SRIKERLLTTIEQIPESRLGELLDFTEFLLEKERQRRGGRLDLDPGKRKRGHILNCELKKR